MVIDLTIIMLTEMLQRYVGSTQGPFKKDITIIQVVSNTKYIDRKLVYLILCGEIKKNLHTDPILKWETV